MFQPRSIQSSLSFADKFFSIDFILVIGILILGITSMFAMYSTDGGAFKYHTTSHIIRFSVFFTLFLFLSFIQIRFWHEASYVIYIIFVTFWSKPTFFNYCHILLVLCISDSNMGTPRLL